MAINYKIDIGRELLRRTIKNVSGIKSNLHKNGSAFPFKWFLNHTSK